MSKVRNPMLVATNTLQVDTGAVNIDTVKWISKRATGRDVDLTFLVEVDEVERPVIWEFTDSTNRDDEFTALTVASDDWDVATRLPFVVSSLSTINAKTKEVIVDQDGINLDLVSRLSILDDLEGFKIVFTFGALKQLKEVVWTYALGASRDTVFDELTNPVGDMTFL